MTEEQEAYAIKLQAMGDTALTEECGEKCWLAAYAGSNPRSKYHWQVDACYNEAKSRGKPWLYQRGWNSAYRSAGYEPSERDLELARAQS